MNHVALVGEDYGLGDAAQRLGSRRQEPVVRADQQGAAFRPHPERSPLGADPRVHNRQIDRIRRHVARGVLQDLGSRLHAEVRHLVREVHDGDAGRDAVHDALARADEVVGDTEVRQKADRPHTLSIKRKTTRAPQCRATAIFTPAHREQPPDRGTSSAKTERPSRLNLNFKLT